MKKKNILAAAVLLCLLLPSLSAQEYALDFTLKDADGNRVTLSDFAGTWVHLDFSTDWCYWCHFQADYFDEVSEMMEEKGADFVSIAILSQDKEGKTPSPEVLLKWMDDYGIEYVLADPGGIVTERYGAEGFPTNIILRPDGSFGLQWSGAHQTAKDFVSALEYRLPEMFD